MATPFNPRGDAAELEIELDGSMPVIYFIPAEDAYRTGVTLGHLRLRHRGLHYRLRAIGDRRDRRPARVALDYVIAQDLTDPAKRQSVIDALGQGGFRLGEGDRVRTT